MKKYSKPVVEIVSEIAEGVYMGSGNGLPSCDSTYMNGTWQAPKYDGNYGYKEQFGCLGCPAYTATGCGLVSHFEDADYSPTYDVDNGKRMPTWEKKGYLPDTLATDFNM